MTSKKEFSDSLIKALNNSILSVPKLATALGIDQEKIYKWKQGSKPSDPEEFMKITQWINDNLENVPRETSQDKIYDTKESVLRMLDKSLDANVRHAAANEKNAAASEKNADTLTQLVQMLAIKFNSNEIGSVSQPSGEKSVVRLDPVEQTSVFVGKSRIVVDPVKKRKKDKV